MLAFSAGNLEVLGRPGWVLTFLYTACAALRLARYNVTPGRYRGRFEGMPSPAAAGIVASSQWFVSFLRDHGVPCARHALAGTAKEALEFGDKLTAPAWTSRGGVSPEPHDRLRVKSVGNPGRPVCHGTWERPLGVEKGIPEFPDVRSSARPFVFRSNLHNPCPNGVHFNISHCSP